MSRGDRRVPGRTQPRRGKQRGHLMAGLMASVAIMMILSTVAFQTWSDYLRRENEAEMIFRAEDIVRAIQRYRKDHGGVGPMKLEDLMEQGPKRQYYLRQLYEDPLVKDGKWGLLYAGPDGAIIDPNAEVEEGGIGGLGAPLGRGGRARRKSAFDNDRGGNRSAFGRASKSGLSKNRAGLSRSPLNPSDSTEMEGLPVAGVKSLCEEKPFRVYNGLTEYREWLFTYVDLEQRRMPATQREFNPDAGQQGGSNRRRNRQP
jgi:type II secretory pathway pseudopilin PulG